MLCKECAVQEIANPCECDICGKALCEICIKNRGTVSICDDNHTEPIAERPAGCDGIPKLEFHIEHSCRLHS